MRCLSLCGRKPSLSSLPSALIHSQACQKRSPHTLPRSLSSLRADFFFFFLNKFIYLFIYLFMAVLGLRFCARAFSSCSEWGPLFIAARGPLTIAASLVGSTGSRRAGSVVVAHGRSCSAACGIFPDQGLNPCPLHWQADSQSLCHQGSPGQISDTEPAPSALPCGDLQGPPRCQIHWVQLNIHRPCPPSP